jgi:hypothetical protein
VRQHGRILQQMAIRVVENTVAAGIQPITEGSVVG